jgi:hypothetical protein
MEPEFLELPRSGEDLAEGRMSGRPEQLDAVQQPLFCQSGSSFPFLPKRLK